MKRTRRFRGFLGVWALLCGIATAFTAPAQDATLPRIGADQARGLAREFANAHGTVELTESPRPLDRDFFYFAATWSNPVGSPMAGYYAVNPWTGDVWDVNACKRLESGRLRREREDIRRRSGISKDAYSELRKKKPLCIESKGHK